mmetsp:Transcript_611/g.839  ORF Transcript_611/g.839 Transcript_611/m.839 type:complete len:280 (+) Transcript_611:138-977(+)
MEAHFERLRRQAKDLPPSKREKIEKSLRRMEQAFHRMEEMKENRSGNDSYSTNNKMTTKRSGLGQVSPDYYPRNKRTTKRIETDQDRMDGRGSVSFQGMKQSYYESRDRAYQDNYNYSKESKTKQSYDESRNRARRDNSPDLSTPTYVRSAGGRKQNPHPPTNKQNRSGRVSGTLKKVTAGGGRKQYTRWLCCMTSREDDNKKYSSISSDTSSSTDQEERAKFKRGSYYEYIDHQDDVFGGSVYEKPKRPKRSKRPRWSKRSNLSEPSGLDRGEIEAEC